MDKDKPDKYPRPQPKPEGEEEPPEIPGGPPENEEGEGKQD